MSADARTPENIERFRQIGAALPKDAQTAVRVGFWERSRYFDGDNSYESVLTRHDYTFGTKAVHVETVVTRPIEDTAANSSFLLTAENKPKGDGTFYVDDLTVSTSGD